MTNIRVAFSTAVLMTGVAFSTTALAQNPATAPTTATGTPTNKPSAAPAAPAGAQARPVVAPGAAAGAPATKPGAPAVPFGTAARPAPVVTSPAGTPPGPKGGTAAPAGATSGATGSGIVAPGGAPAGTAAGGSAAGGAATGGAAAGGAAASAPMPAPNKDMQAFMKGFEGNWRCDTKFVAGAMGPGSPEVAVKSTVRVKKEFGGVSWHGEYSLPKTKTMPAMSGVFQIAHEPTTNGATIVGYDSMGSAFLGTGVISGDSVTFTEEGFMMGTKAKVRETFTKKGPREVSHSYEVDTGKGFQPLGEDSCKR